MEVKRKVDRILWSVFVLCACVSHLCMGQTFDMASWGIVPGGRNLSAKMVKALEEIRGKVSEDSVVIRFREGRSFLWKDRCRSLSRWKISNR